MESLAPLCAMNDIGGGSLINYASSCRLSLSSYRGSDLPNVEALEDLPRDILRVLTYWSSSYLPSCHSKVPWSLPLVAGQLGWPFQRLLLTLELESRTRIQLKVERLGLH